MSKTQDITGSSHGAPDHPSGVSDVYGGVRMRITENDCVGCPQGCSHCGRDISHNVWECDRCYKTTIDQDEFYHGKEHDYCPECYKELYGDIDDAEGE